MVQLLNWLQENVANGEINDNMAVHDFHVITIVAIDDMTGVTTEVEATEEVATGVIRIVHGAIDVEMNEIQG